MMIGVVAWAAGSNRFYIEDFTIAGGATRTVSIVLENETEFTAFQTDIYLPEGLTVEQEDGDYIFDLTGRKARDHNIASQEQPNGSIRLMSYSPSVIAYSGNSGALVTFKVTAASNFAGPAVIALRNTLFSTPTGIELPLDDENCNVTSPNSTPQGDVTGDGILDIEDVTVLINIVLGNTSPNAIIANADMNGDSKIDVEDVTALINKVLNG